MIRNNKKDISREVIFAGAIGLVVGVVAGSLTDKGLYDYRLNKLRSSIARRVISEKIEAKQIPFSHPEVREFHEDYRQNDKYTRYAVIGGLAGTALGVGSVTLGKKKHAPRKGGYHWDESPGY